MSDDKPDTMNMNGGQSLSIGFSIEFRGLQSKLTATPRTRTYYSASHLFSAYHFAALSREMETAFSSGNISADDFYFQHRAYVTGSIFAAASFLEGAINEVFCDAADTFNGPIKLDTKTSEILAKVWRLGFPRTSKYSILEKFTIALELADKLPIDKVTSTYQNADALVKLRNALVHYEPEAVDRGVSGNRQFADIQKRLKGKFDLIPHMKDTSNPFFPDKCLSYGCAKWASLSALKFGDEFFAKLGITSQYDFIKNRLSQI